MALFNLRNTKRRINDIAKNLEGSGKYTYTDDFGYTKSFNDLKDSVLGKSAKTEGTGKYVYSAPSKNDKYDFSAFDMTPENEYKYNSGNWQNNFDYTAAAKDKLNSGDLSGAWNYIYGDTDSRAAKIKDTGNDYGVSNDEAWRQILKDGDYLSQVAALTNKRTQPRQYQGSEWDDIYMANLRKAMGMNYDDWTKGNDYAALQSSYAQNGRFAMDDTLGRVAARTGGLASSYATTAAQQQYNRYMEDLTTAARAMFDKERSNTFENAGRAKTAADRDYSRWKDENNRELDSINQLMDFFGTVKASNDAEDELGRQRQAEEEKARLVQQTQARDAIRTMLEEQGVDVSFISPEMLEASGYTDAEIFGMLNKYNSAQAQKAWENSQTESKNSIATAKSITDIIGNLMGAGFPRDEAIRIASQLIPTSGTAPASGYGNSDLGDYNLGDYVGLMSNVYGSDLDPETVAALETALGVENNPNNNNSLASAFLNALTAQTAPKNMVDYALNMEIPLEDYYANPSYPDARMATQIYGADNKPSSRSPKKKVNAETTNDVLPPIVDTTPSVYDGYLFNDVTDKMKQQSNYQKLLDDGLISEDEYNKRKNIK